MNSDQLRREAITAIFSDFEISDFLALKGGNALRLVYGQLRTSRDIDFSMDARFNEEIGSLARHLELALTNHFCALGYRVLFFNLRGKPSKGIQQFGYELTFKLLEEEIFLRYESQPGKLAAQVSDSRRGIEMEFSKGEFVESVQIVEHGWSLPIRVYTREAIAMEKLRALCQQLPTYEKRKNKTARARDLYDICVLMDSGIELLTDECVAIARSIFSVKDVSPELLCELGSAQEREHHRLDWQSVVDSVPAQSLQNYDYYFERVVHLAHNLHARWNV